MLRHLTRMLAMCFMASGVAGTAEAKQQVRALRTEIRAFDARLYRRLHLHPMIWGQRLLGLLGTGLNRRFYAWLGKTYNFN
jgi:hypothetical protein